MGGQAPTTADFPEPSRDELEREADAAALRQLILRAKSQWNEERATLRAAIEGAGSERVRARSPAASGGPPSKRRRSVETSTPCGEGASLGEMYQKLVFGNSGIKANSAGPAGSRSPREAPESPLQTCRGLTLINAPEATENLSFKAAAQTVADAAGARGRKGFQPAPAPRRSQSLLQKELDFSKSGAVRRPGAVWRHSRRVPSRHLEKMVLVLRRRKARCASRVSGNFPAR